MAPSVPKQPPIPSHHIYNHQNWITGILKNIPKSEPTKRTVYHCWQSLGMRMHHHKEKMTPAAPSLFLKRRTVPEQLKRHYEWGTQAKHFKMIRKKITQDAAKDIMSGALKQNISRWYQRKLHKMLPKTVPNRKSKGYQCVITTPSHRVSVKETQSQTY